MTIIYQYDWKISRVIDGDTIEVIVDFLPPPLTKLLKVKLNPIDAPEIFSPKCEYEEKLGLSVKKFVENLISNAKDIKIVITKNTFDKYGSILADCLLDGVSLVDTLMKKNFVSYYDCEKWTCSKKKNWCESENE